MIPERCMLGARGLGVAWASESLLNASREAKKRFPDFRQSLEGYLVSGVLRWCRCGDKRHVTSTVIIPKNV